jgi:class 3 adenylate cyclase
VYGESGVELRNLNAMSHVAPDRQSDVPLSSSFSSAGVIVSRSVVRKPPRQGTSGERLAEMRASYRAAGNNSIGQLTPKNNRQRVVARAVLEMSPGSPGSMVSEDEDADTINSNISSGSISLKYSPGNERLLQGSSAESSSSHSRRRAASASRKLAAKSRKPESTTSVYRNQEDQGMDRSSRSERRSDRRFGGNAKNNVRRSSSRKRNPKSDMASESRSRSRSLNEKRSGRLKRLPSTKTPAPTSSDEMNRASVTEDEIMELLSLDYEMPLCGASPSIQRDRSTSRDSGRNGRRISSSSHSTESSNSRSPAHHQSSESFSSGDSHKPRRSGGSIGESRGIDRSSSSESFTRPKRRSTPRRTKSDDSAALASFLKQNEHLDRKKKASLGSRSVASMPAKVNQRQRRSRYEGGRGSDRTEDTDDTTIPSSVNSSLGPGPDQDSFKERMGTSGTFHYQHFDENEEGDNLSIDLDLATARTSFQQQNLNEKLQLHLSKTDELLYSVFPKHVADSLRNGQKVEPENHDLVTIFFSDIVGFTDISSTLDPLKISDMLDRLYHSFDALSDYHDVFKVETYVRKLRRTFSSLLRHIAANISFRNSLLYRIGDAYMAVTNLAKKQPDHCKRISEFAIDAIRVANQTLIDEENPDLGFVHIRVGFHSGPVVSNVVGTRNPRYCLFGDTVNTAR